MTTTLSTAAVAALTIKREKNKIIITKIQPEFDHEAKQLSKLIPDAISCYNRHSQELQDLQAIIDKDEAIHTKLEEDLAGGNWKGADEAAQLESKLKSYSKAKDGLKEKQASERNRLNSLTDQADRLLSQLYDNFRPVWMEEEDELLREIFDEDFCVLASERSKKFLTHANRIINIRTHRQSAMLEAAKLLEIAQRQAEFLGRLKEGTVDI